MTETLRSQREALEGLWEKGLSGHELLMQYTSLVDDFIVEQYRSAGAVKEAKGNIAVIALGGYGRRELYPYSDIDLLLLHDWRAKKSIQAVAEALLYPLWDSGFEVGHSVRRVKDGIQFAKEDFFFQVALLDSRLLVGSQSLFDDLLSRYQKKIFNGRRHEFVRTMEKFRNERREKYGSHSYLLEPNIKEGKGGMRDIQAMLWVAKGVYGLQGLEAMESSGMLEQGDLRSFAASWNMLARIRNRLHYIARRKSDRLIFEYQEEMAESFGYTDQGGVLGVEHFMREVYGHLQTIAQITDLFFEHVQELLGITGSASEEQRLERAIVGRAGTIRLLQPDELQERPYLLMRLFLQAGLTGMPLHHRTRRIVTQNLHLVDDRFRSSKRNAQVFFKLLVRSKEPFSVLEMMLVTGFLPSYIPEFATVESLAQHDLYHLYTVDRHQLQTVAELTRLWESMGELFEELTSLNVLYLAAMLHDIGKGKQADHSVLGSEMVQTIGKRLVLSEKERECLGFLVRYHLFMPENALRRDLNDQAFIQQTAELIGDTERLTMLYLLSIADSKATGPSAWSNWKSSLLSDLYLRVKSCLGAGCHLEPEAPGVEKHGVHWLVEQVRERLGTENEAGIDIEQLPADYLMDFTPESVAYHLQLHREQGDRLRQQVLLFPETQGHSWSVLIMTKDRPGLLAKVCGVLALHNLSVLSAQIFTWPDNTAVDVLGVTPVALSWEFEEQDWQGLERDLNLAVNYRFDVANKLYHKMQLVGHRKSRLVQQLECKVIVDNEGSRDYTIIEVYMAHTHGALYHLTQALTDFDLDIRRARIATEVEQLIDVFYVTTRAGDKVTDQVVIEKIRTILLHIIGEEMKMVAEKAEV